MYVDKVIYILALLDVDFACTFIHINTILTHSDITKSGHMVTLAIGSVYRRAGIGGW